MCLSVARKFSVGAREVGGATQQAEVEVLTDPLDGREVDSRAMGPAWLGGLREELEGMFGADPVEVVDAEIEEAPMEHADTVNEDGNPAGRDGSPGQAVVASRAVGDDEHPRSRLQLGLEAARPGDVTTQVHRLPREAGRTRGEVPGGEDGPAEVLDQALVALRRGEHDQDIVGVHDARFVPLFEVHPDRLAIS